MEQGSGVAETVAELRAGGIDVVRVCFPDVIGTDRGRDVLVEALPEVMAHGLSFCRGIYATTPRGDCLPLPGGLAEGLPDVKVQPDLSTLRPLPWEPGVASCLASVAAHDGGSIAEAPRSVLAGVLQRFGELDLRPIIGPELEFFVCEPAPGTPAGWRLYAEDAGNVYVVGRKGDPDNLLLRWLRLLRDYGLPVIAANHEFSGGQFEINLLHGPAMEAADEAYRFKAAVLELGRVEGKLATFMARPFDHQGGSGFHLHLSANDLDGLNAFDDPGGSFGLSERALWAIGGIVAHARALAALLNPTVNSYKRFGPDTLAPWLVDWGLDNRSAMVRIPPERGGGSRLEARLGDASANPYLAVAGLLAAAYLGIRDRVDPGEPLQGYGYDSGRSPTLPATLPDALDALEADSDLVQVVGKGLVEVLVAYKRDEVRRYDRAVTDWEFREYAYHL